MQQQCYELISVNIINILPVQLALYVDIYQEAKFCQFHYADARSDRLANP